MNFRSGSYSLMLTVAILNFCLTRAAADGKNIVEVYDPNGKQTTLFYDGGRIKVTCTFSSSSGTDKNPLLRIKDTKHNGAGAYVAAKGVPPKVEHNISLNHSVLDVEYSCSDDDNTAMNIKINYLLCLKLTNEEVQVAVSIRIGSKVVQEHSCRCGQRVQGASLHGLACHLMPGRRTRHSEVNSIIQRALQSAGLPSILEPIGLQRADGKRPDGKTLVPWECGKAMVWDFTCTDTFAPSNIVRSAKVAQSAAMDAERRKTAKYAELGNSFKFVPVAVETSGALGPSAICFL